MNQKTFEMGPRAAALLELKKIGVYGTILVVVLAYNWFSGVYG